MRQAVYCANFGALGDPVVLVDLAMRAERAGWDGFFVYDHILIDPTRAIRSADPWTVLGAVASRTELMIGPLVTPLARRQPWEVAHQALTLAAMSPGKVVLGVGLGESMDHDAFGSAGDLRARGRHLDEALSIVVRLLEGTRVDHRGHWRIAGAQLRPPSEPVPIWVGGRYSAAAPMRRAARFDGFFPIGRSWGPESVLTSEELGDCVTRLRDMGVAPDYQFVHAGVSKQDGGGAAAVSRYAAAGATWWLEIIEPQRAELSGLYERVDAGPVQLGRSPSNLSPSSGGGSR